MGAAKKIIAALILLCMAIGLAPAACAEGEADYEGLSWDDVMEQLLEPYDEAARARIAVGYYNTATGEEHYLNGDKFMVAGSTYKVPLNMYYTEKIYNGEMEWETQVYGIRYDWLLEGSIVSSNNDYAEKLWRSMSGSNYHTYRRMIAPYMGEDPDTVDAKYYENNFFTAREMISCLKLLYDEQERFPGVIDAMLRAEPNNYFNYIQQDFEIAHKYGFLKEEYHEYVNDCGIAFTDEPILLVVFTDNTAASLNFMSGYCAKMCGYTQYNTAKRIEEEAAAAAAAEAEAAEAAAAAATETAPEPQQTETVSMAAEEETWLDFESLILCAAIGLGALIAMILLISCAVRYRINGFWAVLSVLLTGAALAAAVIGSARGTLIAKAGGDPAETAAQLMDALVDADYDTAYGYISNYSGLGLENEPADQVGQMMYAALRDSYSYSFTGPCRVDKLEAVQPMSFTYLELSSISEDVEAKTMEVLEGFVSTRPRNELYDGEDNYLPEVAQEAYVTALSSVLEHAEDYYKTESMNLRLIYSDEQWQAEIDTALIKALGGGTY